MLEQAARLDSIASGTGQAFDKDFAFEALPPDRIGEGARMNGLGIERVSQAERCPRANEDIVLRFSLYW